VTVAVAGVDAATEMDANATSVAGDGTSALDLLEQASPNAVILDNSMPGLTGIVKGETGPADLLEFLVGSAECRGPTASLDLGAAGSIGHAVALAEHVTPGAD